MIRCAFTGHREVYQPGVDERIEKTIEKLLEQDAAITFYTGGMGEFDSKCASIVRIIKRQYPSREIRLSLVLPYLTNRLNADKDYYETYFDKIIIPEALSGVHYKAAIQKRNHWMADQADCLIAYVLRDFGGAFETVRYARKKGKTVYNLAEQ